MKTFFKALLCFQTQKGFFPQFSLLIAQRSGHGGKFGCGQHRLLSHFCLNHLGILIHAELQDLRMSLQKDREKRKKIFRRFSETLSGADGGEDKRERTGTRV